MKNKEILRNYNALMARAMKEREEIEKNKDFPRLPIKVIHAIHTNQIELEKAIKPYAESINELGSKYNVEMTIFDLNKKRSEIAENKAAEFDKDLTELLDVDVNVDIKKISVEEFGNYQISQEDYELIAFMIK